MKKSYVLDGIMLKSVGKRNGFLDYSFKHVRTEGDMEIFKGDLHETLLDELVYRFYRDGWYDLTIFGNYHKLNVITRWDRDRRQVKQLLDKRLWQYSFVFESGIELKLKYDMKDELGDGEFGIIIGERSEHSC